MLALDHLVYGQGARSRRAAIAELAGRLAVRPAYGGRHPGRGTRNALVALSEISYLEIVAPDPEQPEFTGTRWLGVGDPSPRLVTWAVKCDRIGAAVADAARADVHLGAVRSGSRRTGDGDELRWRLTDPEPLVDGGIVPFLIDWGTSRHPAATAPHGPTLLSLRAEHPDASRVAHALDVLGAPLPVAVAPRAALIATLQTPRAMIEPAMMKRRQ